jgi:hypothetical protein
MIHCLNDFLKEARSKTRNYERRLHTANDIKKRKNSILTKVQNNRNVSSNIFKISIEIH